MTKKFRDYAPDQPYLLPPSPADWLPEGHVVYFIRDVMEHLDLSAIYKVYRESGQPPYDPSMMTAVWLYAYSQGVRSSRKVERALKENVAFRFLSGNQQPDFWTLNQFRKRHRPALAGIFLQSVRLAMKAGVVKLGHVSLDGTKIKANASKHAAMSYERMIQEEARLKAELEQYLDEVDAADEAEEGEPKINEVPEELRHAAKRLSAIRKAREELENEAREKAQAEQEKRKVAAAKEGREYNPRADASEAKPGTKAQRNFTDPESRIMRNSDKAFVQAYNGQAVVDSDSHVIIAASLTNQAADAPHLESMVRQAESNCGSKPDEFSADGGYFSDANLAFLSQRGIEAFMPAGRVKRSEWRDQKSPRGRIPKDATPKDLMSRKLKTKRGRARYKLRHITSEPVFGHIKSARGLQQFLHRGLEKVRDYWLLDCCVHNLLRMFRLGVKFE